MFRYIAFMWNASDTSQINAARFLAQRVQLALPGWKTLLNRDGLAVYATATTYAGVNRSHLMHGDLGVVLGTLFERKKDPLDASASPQALLHDAATKEILTSGGSHLISNYWGSYVAFGSDPSASTTWVLKDPTGTLPCLRAKHSGVHILFSCLSDCMALDVLKLSVNWNDLISRIVIGMSGRESTSLVEVHEVRSGERIELKNGCLAQTFLWNPYLVAKVNIIDDADYAATALRSTITSCVHTWAMSYRKLLLRLSGGLDSSIVMACLANSASQPQMLALTYFLPRGNSDERPWARLAAHRAKCEQIELARNPGAVDMRKLMTLAPSAVPPNTGYTYLTLGPVERKLAQERETFAIFTGDGGDALFGSHSKHHILGDYLHINGPRLPLFRLASDVALLTNTSIWKVLGDSLRDYFLNRGLNLAHESRAADRTLLSPDVLAHISKTPNFCHPWFSSMEQIPPGTASLMLDLSVSRPFYDPSSNLNDANPEHVYPLLSQPIVELCLRIPSYVHSECGRDRGLVRRAFEGSVPSEILQRHWKDRGSGAMETTLLANIDFAREMLLEGILVKQGLLKPKSLEEALAGPSPKRGSYTGEIMSCLITEAWARSWLSTGSVDSKTGVRATGT